MKNIIIIMLDFLQCGNKSRKKLNKSTENNAITNSNHLPTTWLGI